jgi:hypothetical protein
MAYSVTKLIAEAFYTSGIVSRQFQTVAGDQERTAFDALNEILSDTLIETDMIPYYTTAYDFRLVAGQERYYIPNLTKPETMTFFIDSVRYQMNITQKDKYFGSGRADNVNSLPFNWNWERTLGGVNLFLYFFPERPYPAQITGWFTLNQVSLYQDLTSPLASANLGVPVVLGTGTLNPGELVVNGVDLAGTYATPQALVTYINTMPPIPYVSAAIVQNQFILSNRSSGSIFIETTGNQDPANNISFSNFSTINGPLTQTFMPQALDQFYINYLQYRLAERLCTKYNFIVPAGCADQLLMYKQMISKKSAPLDLSINKISTLTRHSSINYAQVNLGHGWTTP